MAVVCSPSSDGNGAAGENREVKVGYDVRKDGSLARCGRIKRGRRG